MVNVFRGQSYRNFDLYAKFFERSKNPFRSAIIHRERDIIFQILSVDYFAANLMVSNVQIDLSLVGEVNTR